MSNVPAAPTGVHDIGDTGHLAEVALDLPGTDGAPPRPGVGVALVNFNTSAQTLRCLESLRASTVEPDWIFVLDNASRDDEWTRLVEGVRPFAHAAVRVHRARVNLGFAQGNNLLIDALLAHPDCRYVVLLNNDAVAEPEMLERLVEAARRSTDPAVLVGGRLNRLDDPREPDSLGISLYASLMPANRLDASEAFLGPTGGCCLVTRELVANVKAASGYVFDPRFFCYCEDTDLALRALLLGHAPSYAPDAVALHEGQASTGGIDSDFIAYHGLRNLAWMHAKLVPARLLVKYGVLLVVAHLLTIVRQLLSGRPATLFRVYRDAWRRMPEFLAERKRFAGRGGADRWRELDRLIAPRFYRKGYAGEVLRQLRARYARSA